MIRVAIVDDQKLLSESLKSIIENDHDLKVIGCASNGREALEICSSSKPDIVLMDIKMPVCDGIEGTRMIKEKYPEIKVLILTTFEDDQNVYEALKNGADGYILKDITPEELIQAVKNASRGFSIFSRSPFGSVVKKINDADESAEKNDNPISIDLKEREVEIIRMIAEGMSNKEIASKLCLSFGRTKNIISEILAKLDLSDRNQLASFAFKNKLI
ncbi:response regulator transcription factor [Acetivibrio cellulolyticus]|uniref:response regulator transcription factor n=1 Tax=Acetivibrio cellulolyticus TaxID=35830 RepID=UPI0001E2D419|nr:response regulator transcription factor [Acetivibrio cellulolyticus]